MFGIVIYLLVPVSAAPISTKDFLDIFENPITSFVNAISPKKSVKNVETGTTEQHGEDNPAGKMIDVPINTDRCKYGTVKDVNGVCRDPW